MQDALSRRSGHWPTNDGTFLARHRLFAYAACVLLALVVNYYDGPDLSWDTLNYHLYAGLSALQDRFGLDYFAAGPQSYLNPSAYVPFYLLVRSGLSALAASSVLAVMHASIPILSYELALVCLPAERAAERLALAACAAALALMNPLLLNQIGSSFADITTAAIALGGWYLLVRWLRFPRAATLVCGAALLGIATALKLTNAVHAVAAAAIVVSLDGSLRQQCRSLLIWAASLAAAFTVVAAPWAFRLYREFGNPFFPLLNPIFKSPQFPLGQWTCLRFVPSDLGEALWRPFAIANPAALVQAEWLAPDARYAVLIVVAILAAAAWFRRRGRSPATPGPSSSEARAIAALAACVAVDWVLWLVTSGNGRYALPLACATAVLIIALARQVLAGHRKALSYSLLAIFALQAAQLTWGSDVSRIDQPWSRPWFDVVVPRRLAVEPNLYLSLGIQSDSFLLPFLARGSGAANVSGGFELGADDANGRRVRELLRDAGPHVRFLVLGDRLHAGLDTQGPQPELINDAVERFGLRVDPRDCEHILVRGLPPPLEATVVHSGDTRTVVAAPKNFSNYLSCRLITDTTIDQASLNRRRAEVDKIFARLESACPALFQPAGIYTQHAGHRWLRIYPNTDINAWVSFGEVKVFDPIHSDNIIDLGSELSWLAHPRKLTCERKNGHYSVVVAPEPNRQ